ncbi:MAG: glycosyltransferase [Gimesia chilikensis]|uniref:glycosyltransferase n=1 Tax=Gimesia chilikensis TaxID=2605989 RepID=UPI0037999FD8
MLELATISVFCLLCFALLNLYWGQRVARLYQAHLAQKSNSSYTPSAAVVLSLRGNDPFLADCLQGLLNQDYPAYQVKIIVDHIDDPAFAFVTQYLAEHEHPHCDVSIREVSNGVCGLKNASLVQAIREVDNDVEVLAWLDADVIPHRGWLRELVSPLQDPEVGVASGIRWYAPRHANPGTMVRHAWNTAAMMQMVALEIPWGGSIALSREIFTHPQLTNSFSRMLWDDTGLKVIADQLGRRVAFVPATTMVNRESISFNSCFRYMTRQLVNARYYHPHWWLVAGLGLMTAVAQTALLVLSVLFMLQGDLTAAASSAGVLLFANGCVAVAIFRISLLVHKTVTARGEHFQRQPLRTLGYLGITVYIFAAALLAAMRTRTIDWRGVLYHVPDPFNVQIMHYEPYRHPEANASLHELEHVSI